MISWGEKGRNVDKAEYKERMSKEASLADRMTREDAWYKSQSSLDELSDSLAIALNEVNMRKLSVRKAEILFNSGKNAYKDVLTEKMALNRVRISAAAAKQSYLIQKLNTFTLSGKLLDRYVELERESTDDE